jgi:phage shock protein C
VTTRPDTPFAAAHRPPGPDEARRLRRSRDDRVLGGVCGGLGRHLGVDPVLVRIALVALVLSGGLGVLLYVIAWVVVPEADGHEAPATTGSRHGAALVAGATLVAVGALLLVREALPWFTADVFWPLVVVVAGLLLVASARRP